MSPSQPDIRRAILERLVAAPVLESQSANEALREHGPITADELPFLEEQAKSRNNNTRRNAAQLLRLAPPSEAKAILQRVAQTSADPAVYALALEYLVDSHDGVSESELKPKLLREAIASPHGEVAASGLRAAFLTNQPGVWAELAAKLDSTDPEVRSAAVELLGKAGAGPFEGKLREILLRRDRSTASIVTDIYRALCHSDDPGTADVFRQSLKEPRVEGLRAFSNGVALSRSRQPWLRDFLLGEAMQGERLGVVAFDLLRDWGEPAVEKALLGRCIEQLDRKLPVERSKQWLYDPELEPCRNFLNSLAKRTFNWDELFVARDFARQRTGELRHVE